MNSGVGPAVACAPMEMPGPGVPGREGLRQAEADGSWEREHQESLWQLSVTVSGGNDVLISQIINKYIFFIKNMDHLLIANHDIYLFDYAYVFITLT